MIWVSASYKDVAPTELVRFSVATLAMVVDPRVGIDLRRSGPFAGAACLICFGAGCILGRISQGPWVTGQSGSPPALIKSLRDT